MAQDGVIPEVKVQDTYKVGQKICLWQEHVDQESGKVLVLKEVIVTITETKTGVPGEFTSNPSSRQSLRGIGDDGKTYEKHWDEWPESQTNDFMDRWSMREDGDGENRFWSPREAVYAHNRILDHNQKHGAVHGLLIRVDQQGQPILPKGDIVHCESHDDYYYPGTRCFHCFLDEAKAAQA